MAVICADVCPETLNKRSVGIWHCFRGEVRNNPAIARYSDTRDKRLRDIIFRAFNTLIKRECLNCDPDTANEAILDTLALLEGMWVDYMTHSENFDRENAVRIVRGFLNGVVPGAFLCRKSA